MRPEVVFIFEDGVVSREDSNRPIVYSRRRKPKEPSNLMQTQEPRLPQVRKVRVMATSALVHLIDLTNRFRPRGSLLVILGRLCSHQMQ